MNITIQDIVDQAARATDIVSQVRGRMLAPNARKNPPVFNASQLAALCEVDKSQITYRTSKGDLPPGTVNATGSRREFSLPEAREWVRAYRANALRPENAPAMTVAIGNFKGGVSKTTTAMTLAQGLSLRGHRVLVIDTDPQGSLTTLFGILPDTEVEEDSTITALATGDQSSIEYAIRETYWDGIDLVPASSSLFNVEFILPSRQMKEPDFEFWNVLNTSLEQARSNYDVIIIDTPPALSYGTVNAFMAADGLIVPTPPNALDFASSAQFWTLFSDLASNLTAETNTDKSFEFIHVLLSRVDPADAAAGVVREWISATYAEKVLPVEIPKTAVTAASSAEFGTVYDISRYDGNAKTYRRAREAYDRVTEIVEQSIVAFWAKSE
ncbi:ParA family protein [Paraburkholderia azotifigens]|uniref:AAA family ATPase n=1 Tax=Paraburkholderia azotifigens TaxID=2057004 RepID=A0A5C6V7T4_9BURK|nr:AAA family ATPase [Paraburkholderia azotifigens]TXC80611.1 AAA family ATPase [Paraburkholderia azotifigens]